MPSRTSLAWASAAADLAWVDKNNRLYVSTENGYLVEINTTANANTVVQSTQLPDHGRGIAVSPTTNTVYITGSDNVSTPPDRHASSTTCTSSSCYVERLLNYPMPGPVSPGHDNPGYRPGGPQRRTTGLWISLAVAVVIIVLLSAVVITQLKDDASDTSTPRRQRNPPQFSRHNPAALRRNPAAAAARR